MKMTQFNEGYMHAFPIFEENLNTLTHLRT